MKEQDLRKLTRSELLEMLIQQGEELEELRETLQDYELQLRSRKLQVEQAGSIAEAAIQVSGVFDAAEAAAAQYLENIREHSEKQASYTEEARLLLENTRIQCAEMKAKTAAECEKMTQKAKKEALSYWTKVSRKIEAAKEE